MTAAVGTDEEPRTSRLRALIDARQRCRGAQVFLQDARTQRAVTYQLLAEVSRGWAHVLTEQCLDDGARILVDVDDPLTCATTQLCLLAAGQHIVPVDPEAPPGEIARILRVTEPVLVVTDRAERGVLYPRVRVLVIDPELLGRPREGSDDGRTETAARLARTEAPAPSGSVSLSTSGSTGEPKVVELDERRLLHVAGAVVDHHRLVPGDRGYSPLPLFHVNAQVVAVLATFLAGATVVLDRRFRRHGFWQLLQAREITWLNAVPAILSIVAADKQPAQLPGLRFVRSASAPLPPSVRDRIAARLCVPVVESYGMTEAASQITATALHSGNPLHASAPPGSVGRPVSGELQVREPEGALAAPGVLGRIWIRGRGVISHYADGRAAERFDGDGWLDTGDLGRVDTDGFVFLAGRADDVINRGGEMVHPREVEEVLLSHPRVAEAVVVGKPDGTLGAVPVGYVLAHHGANAGLTDELQQWCALRLSRYKQPVALHVVTDFPRAATGKIRRYEVA